ncbi:MAG TPA: hypothetical protein VJB66_04180 [Candidatus Nanoarchaeia archaeon]|nr:hypothetical protein [Candidatus Nanoarchaeia archaeon]
MVRIDINFTPGKQPEIKIAGQPVQPNIHNIIHANMQPVQPVQHMHTHPAQHPNEKAQPQSEQSQSAQPTQPNAVFLNSEMLLQYLLGTNDQVETLILCKPNNLELVTSDFNLYEALGSVKQPDNITFNKITKLLEAVEITSFKEITNANKPILKEDRVEELRNAVKQKINPTGGI